MKYYKALLLVILIYSFTFCTGQWPEEIIIGSDTLSMYSNPLPSYIPFYWWRGIPKKFKRGGYNTGCYRGYKGLWEIRNDSLYLRDVISSDKKFIFEFNKQSIKDLENNSIPDSIVKKLVNFEYDEFEDYDAFLKRAKAIIGKDYFDLYQYQIQTSLKVKRKELIHFDLNELVGEISREKNFFAATFTGILKTFKGPPLKYVHAGWSSVYDNEIFYEVLKGKILTKLKIHTFFHKVPCNLKQIHYCEKGIHIWLPDSISRDGYYVTNKNVIPINVFYPLKSNQSLISLADTTGNYFVYIKILDKNKSSYDEYDKIVFAKKNIENLISNFNNYSFDSLKIGKVYNPTVGYRWQLPYLVWAYGQSKNDSSSMILATIDNEKSKVILQIYSKSSYKEEMTNLFNSTIENMSFDKN